MSITTANIMVVDDEVVNLKLLERVLSSNGFQNIELISDSRNVIASYKRVRPDLILLDINMPWLDGYQVMQHINALNDALEPPILILTAQHGNDFLMKALQYGARDFVGKPFEQMELMMRVKNALSAQFQKLEIYHQKDTLEELVQERTRELQDTRLSVVQRLGKAAEYRDEETGNHILRMSHCCKMLAESIGWDDYQADLILNASPMHDIGKIGIPDHILLKPGKFEPDEWETMKSHASIGAMLLDGDDSDLMLMAKDIAQNHHEKWDGSGYPNGLAGADIPESARIAAVCDVFDALTSIRPYKKAWPIEDAVALLQDNKDRHFEGRLVEAFLDNLDQVLEIRRTFSD